MDQHPMRRREFRQAFVGPRGGRRGTLAVVLVSTMASVMASACGDEDRVLFVREGAEPSRQVSAASPPDSSRSDAGSPPSSNAVDSRAGDAGPGDSLVEGVSELPLDNSTGDDLPSDSPTSQRTALEALANEQTADAFCRWQAVLDQQQQDSTDEQCRAQALECQEEATGAEGGEQQLPRLMQTVTEDLQALEGCDIPPESADRCVGELIVVLEPYAETMECGQPPGPMPPLQERVAELPSCLGILFVCPSALDSLQQSLTAAI